MATKLMGSDVDSYVDDAEKGKVDPCAKYVAKVERQEDGSAMKKMAERELAACRARQTTDSNNS